VHTMSRFIKWMIQNGHEEDPGIRPGDIFANNDAFIGTVHVPDVMDVMPIYYEGELIGWAGAVAHELEVGGITPGGDVYLDQDRFTATITFSAQHVATNIRLSRNYLISIKKNVSMHIYRILYNKSTIASSLDMRKKVTELIKHVNFDYSK